MHDGTSWSVNNKQSDPSHWLVLDRRTVRDPVDRKGMIGRKHEEPSS
jgi:hypothetical protein